MPEKIRVLVWGDASGLHKPERPLPYRGGVHQAIAEFLNEFEDLDAFPFAVSEDCFTPQELDRYQAIVLWGHGRPISMGAQRAIVAQVESGKAGMVGLHSILNFNSNPFLIGRLFGQTRVFGWEEHVHMKFEVTRNDHPIFEGIDSFEVEDEAYYEPFGLVEGADVLLNMEVPGCETRKAYFFDPGTREWGEKEFRVAGLVSRAAWAYTVGNGKSFYLQPGHETDPTYHDPIIKDIIARAVQWVAVR